MDISRDTSRRATVVVLCALTVGAYLLRLAGIGESLFGDELFAYDAVQGHGLADVVDRVTEGEENSPPLFFVLAWVATKLGSDPTVLIRLPSLLLGTATVPVVYLLGKRTVGRVAGLMAAALTAFSPLAVYFSAEARPYATLMFLVALSTLTLLNALQTRGAAWWVLFSTVSVAALYTHYTAVPVIAVQGMWALWAHRARARQVLFAYAAIAGACLVWAPFLLEQGGTRDLGFIGAVFPLSFDSFARFTAQLVPGYQRMGLGEVPGPFAMWLFGVAVGVGLVGAVAHAWPRRAEVHRTRPSKKLVLIVVLALVTPSCVLLYSLLGPDIYTTRHLLASFPALVILLGALFTRLPYPAAVATTLIAFTALTIGLVRAVDPDRDRPPLKEAARFIDARAGPTDPVVEFVFLGGRGLSTHHLDINFTRQHLLYQTGFLRPAYFWADLEDKRRIFVVKAWGGPNERSPLPPEIDQQFRLTEARVWRGSVPVTVLEYTSRNPSPASLERPPR